MSDPTRLDDALAAYVAEIVAAWPPLAPAQRDRLAVLLRPAPHIPALRDTDTGTAPPLSRIRGPPEAFPCT